MATMIPPILPKKNVSPGERAIFLRLRDDPLTEGWIVLHSLDIADHRQQIFGEIDFVIIVPAKGVVCLEVKSHTRIQRVDGIWYYGNKLQPDVRGPFKQASEAMHSIRKYITAKQPNLSRIIFWSAAAFPFAPFNIESTEWHSWQVIDSQTFRSRSIGSTILSILENARTFLSTKSTAQWFDTNQVMPDASQSQTLVNLLRPNFEFFESPHSRAERLEEELKYYTSEQLSALDAMQENPRVIFQGPAGTGKTMLAIEAARRSAEANRKVLFLCYNSLLGTYLSKQTKALQPLVTTRTLHSHMLKVAGMSISQQDHKFWSEQLPLAAIDKLLENTDDAYLYDELIIDEAQDILHEPYLDFLDLSLQGGLAFGRWRLFGDFEKQAIFGSSILPLDAFRTQRGGNASVYSLRANCRNVPRIVSLVHLLGGLSPHYSRILRPDNLIEPEYKFYKNPSEQREILIQVLEQLTREGFSYKDIVVISPRSDKLCAAASITTRPWKERLRPYSTNIQSAIRYSSIHAYKGMESPAVVVTDIDQIGTEQAQALLYIALTRSFHRLVLLINTQIQMEMLNMLVSSSH